MCCFNLNPWDELWKFEYNAAAGQIMFPGSRSVPVIDGDYIYSCGPFGDLYCIDIKAHNPVLNKNVCTDFGGDSENAPSDESEEGLGGFGGRGNFLIWNISQCPMLYGDLLILASQAPEAGVVAYDKTTGDIVWKTPNLGNETYVSPSLAKIDGNDHIVMVTASGGGRGGEPHVPGNVVGIVPLSGGII